MKLVLVTGALVLLGVLLGVDHVRNRFEHSPRSRRILAAEAVVSYLIAVVIATRLLPGVLHWAVPLAAVIALPVFVLMAVVTMEVWRVSRRQEFDAEISRIERQQTDILERRDELQRRLGELKRQQSRRGIKSDAGLFRRRQLQRQVETWVQEGGFARIRSLRVEEWGRETDGWPVAQIQARMSDLERQAGAAGDGEQREQIEVQRALAELNLLAGSKRPSEQDPDDLDRMVDELTQAVEECGLKLGELQVDLEAWRRRRSFFQRQKLRLE